MPDRTYPAANNLAIEIARTKMRAAGRSQPNAADTEFLLREKARLLMHVDADQGGFLGLPDDQMERRAHRYGLPIDYVVAAVYARGEWPGEEVKIAEAAE